MRSTGARKPTFGPVRQAVAPASWLVAPAFLLIYRGLPDIITFTCSYKFTSLPADGERFTMAEKKFEAAMARLEEIVQELEKGDVPLEQSLKLFEEGIKLSRICNKRLEEAERKVEILLKDKNGSVTAEPFEEEE
jgi:exodeoxyribonuclease VII small subunit